MSECLSRFSGLSLAVFSIVWSPCGLPRVEWCWHNRLSIQSFPLNEFLFHFPLYLTLLNGPSAAFKMINHFGGFFLFIWRWKHSLLSWALLSWDDSVVAIPLYLSWDVDLVCVIFKNGAINMWRKGRVILISMNDVWDSEIIFTAFCKPTFLSIQTLKPSHFFCFGFNKT